MRIFKLLLLVLSILGCSIAADAQKKPGKTKPAAQKFIAPKLRSMLDKYQGSVSMTADEASNIIGLPLKIYDANKKEYSISSYQFIYKKVGVTEDENTGKLTATSTMSADRFRSTPLPAVWINTIKQQLQKGEELHFVDIIAKDDSGHVMYAPELTISIN